MSDLLSQLLDDGMLTDSQGNAVSFRNCMVVFTANSLKPNARPSPSNQPPTATPSVPSEASHQQQQQQQTDASAGTPSSSQAPAPSNILPVVAANLSGRVDVTATFTPLQPADMHVIVDRQLQAAGDTLSQLGLQLQVDAAAKEWLATAGSSKSHGARLLSRLVQQNVVAAAVDAAMANNEGLAALQGAGSDGVLGAGASQAAAVRQPGKGLYAVHVSHAGGAGAVPSVLVA